MFIIAVHSYFESSISSDPNTVSFFGLSSIFNLIGQYIDNSERRSYSLDIFKHNFSLQMSQ